jgi:hypothetical protein
MSTAELIERIKALPPRELAAVEAYVRDLTGGGASVKGVSGALAMRIVARRERLRERFGAFSAGDDIRYLRDHGPR